MKVAFFTETKWAFGMIHYALCRHLTANGIVAEIIDFGVRYQGDKFREMTSSCDFLVTDPGAAPRLVDDYGISHDRVIIVSHGEPDIIRLLKVKGLQEFDKFRAFGCVSESIFLSSVTLGIRRLPSILSLGVDVGAFDGDVPENLNVVGYATIMSRKNAYGVEIKRGHLVQKAAEAAGLAFRPAVSVGFREMPSYYKGVDAVVMSSLQEGAGLPVMEAAAAGRLVIGTPVGHFPRRAYQGAGILTPLDAGQFVKFTTDALLHYKNNPTVFHAKCLDIKKAAGSFDWKHVISDWVIFFKNA